MNEKGSQLSVKLESVLGWDRIGPEELGYKGYREGRKKKIGERVDSLLQAAVAVIRGKKNTRIRFCRRARKFVFLFSFLSIFYFHCSND